MKQRIKEETQTTDIVERIKLIEVAEQEVARRQCELDAKVKKPAEAEKFRLEIMAEATKVSIIWLIVMSRVVLEIRGLEALHGEMSIMNYVFLHFSPYIFHS